MDKLNIIKNSIEQIREVIGEPCDHIENLPEKINKLVEDASKVGYSTVFVFSNEENPNKPTGDLYENGIVSNLDVSWSQTKIEDSAKVWMSFSLFKQSGEQISDWVTPILITRFGKDGIDGKDAFTPQFKIQDGYWYVQYSENGEWVKVGQATGDKGDPGEKGDPGKDGVDGSNGVNGPQGEPGIDGETGRGIESIEKLFAVNNDPSNYPTEGWTTIQNASTSSTNRYMWCKETTTFTSGDPTVIHYIVAVEGEPGANGTGGDAPIIYPAGVWDGEKEYIAESDKVPYVLYTVDEKYYMLNSKYLIIGEGEGSVWKGAWYAPGKTYEDEPIWLPIDSFEAIYADIGLFNQALVGKWVFHGNYMFSQEGILGYYVARGSKYKLYVPSGIGSGTISEQNCSYEVALNPTLCQYSGGEFNTTIRSFNLWEKIENGIWIPNVLFNAVTGEGWFARKKIQFNVDGSGSLGNGIVWNNNGDITVDGAIFNPVIEASDTVSGLNKTVCVDGNLKSPTLIKIDPYVSQTSDVPIKKIGQVTVSSINLNDPTYVDFLGASIQVSKIHTDRSDKVLSQNNEYSSFIISPGATITFDVFDDYNKGKRYLRPQIQMGWFNRLGDVLPCTFNNIDYLDISAITHTANSIGSKMDAGQFYELISLPANLVKYMSIKFNSLNDTYNSQIWFQKEADGIVPSIAHSIVNALNEAFYVKNSIVPFREGGSFGIGAYGTSPSISSNAYVDICLYDSNTMIGWFGFNI